MAERWPERLFIVRHGESAGNVARDLAQQQNLLRIDVTGRDVDVPLSPLGEQQSRALGHWFAGLPESERPEVVLCSPYLRARHTAELIAAEGRLCRAETCFFVDERLREKEFGVLDRLTRRGIAELLPEQAEHRAILGKFYHRPPGGESWCDVILRLRSALDTMSLHHAGKRVLIVGHQVVVLCLRYLIEAMTEEEILRIDREADVANCSVTEYVLEGGSNGAERPFAPGAVAWGRVGPQDGHLVLKRYNFTAPLEIEGAPVTTRPDAIVAAR